MGSYFFGYFESMVDLEIYSITTNLWLEDYSKMLYSPTQFLLPKLYFLINNLLGIRTFFSLFMCGLNTMVILGIGGLIYRYVSVLENNKLKKWLLFLLIFIFFISSSLFKINSTRISLLGGVFIFMLIIYMDIKKIKITLIFMLAIIVLSIVFSLLRMEAILLLGLFIGIPLSLFRYNFKYLLPLFLSLFVFAIYNYTLSIYGNEEMKLFYYYENQLLDDSNICVDEVKPDEFCLLYNEEIDENDSISLFYTALTEFSLPDKINFNEATFLDFFCTDNKNMFLSFVFGRVNFKSWHTNFSISYEISKNSHFVIVVAFSFLLLLLFSKSPVFIKAIFILYYLLPLFLLFHIETPNRFLKPYFLIFVISSFLFIYIYSKSYLKVCAVLLMSLTTLKESIISYNWINQQKQHNNRAIDIINKIDVIDNKRSFPIILQIGSAYELLPTKVSYLPPNLSGVLFMDDYFLYKQFKMSWKEKCNCSSINLLSRVKFAIKSEALYISKQENMEFLKVYLYAIYGFKIQYKKINQINQNNLFAYKIIQG